MLRGQHGRGRNIKGELQIFGSFPSPRPRPLFSSGHGFMVGFGKLQLNAKFEVATFSSCTDIKENSKFWELF